MQDTVGCCSLRAEHITPFTKDGKFFLNFDFLGKDSIRYYNDVEISEAVFHLVKKLLVGKDSRPLPKNQVFNEVETSDLNAHFKKFMKGLSAKVFRTYNASYLLDKVRIPPLTPSTLSSLSHTSIFLLFPVLLFKNTS